MYRVGVIAAALGVASAGPVIGQNTSALSLEASVGGGAGVGGSFTDRGAFASDVMFGLRLRSEQDAGALFAIALEWQGAMSSDDVCLVAPTGGCVPNFPPVSSLVALAGWESGRMHGSTFRLLAGPRYFKRENSHVAGLEYRGELATPAPFHVALVGFARGDVLARLSDRAFAIWAIGVGLRIE